MRRLFVGRLSKRTRTRDVEDVFKRYGKMSRCEVKYGQDTAYAFVDYEDDRDAEDALKCEDGRKLLGATMIVEWSKGVGRRLPVGRPNDECYRCGRRGHFGRDCTMSGFRNYGRGRSPRRSRYSRSRSRSRSYHRRSASRSQSPRKRRSSSGSPRNSVSPRDDRSRSKSRSKSPQKSKSRSPEQQKSPETKEDDTNERKSQSRSRSRSNS